ncbi:hypothetical protein MNEG_1150 [Monoraphidium neglectum]|uniref:Uncharacterized protein n=1 Tax=Monoraphidium neglectum TaxID=145388 RepID=A0A0D2LK87_9CHLO|nr:hypothetical protein MNEG_1150 [Monoraphidium neglectum]KIZ06794.1 hypothetical protein MNEG_1150 [Monoraphidium neglectum]|eukprot:XP_013905813.1 hypothetical protein MNEG_1150 [Monoraphidium neglectum]
MAAAGDPYQLTPRAVGALLPALAATGHDPGPLWLAAASAALHFRREAAHRRDVVAALSALAALRHAPAPAVVSDLLARLQGSRENVSRLRGAELVELLAALKRMRYRPSRTFLRLLMEAAVEKLPRMTAAQLAALLRGLSWAGARPGAAWGREFVRRSWAVLPGAGPGALADLLHFALLLRLQPHPRWAHDCLALLRDAQRTALSQRRVAMRTRTAADEAAHTAAAGPDSLQQQQQQQQQQQLAQQPTPPEDSHQQHWRWPDDCDGSGSRDVPGAPPLLTPHQIALSAHALALLPQGGHVAASHRQFLCACIGALQPRAAQLPLRELSYLLYAVGRLRMEVPQGWLQEALEQVHLLTARGPVAGEPRMPQLQHRHQQQERQQQQQEQQHQQVVMGKQQQAPPPRQQRGRSRLAQAADEDAPAAEELAAAFSLMAHFSAAAEPQWVHGALEATAAVRHQLSDEALVHTLVGCAALELSTNPPPDRARAAAADPSGSASGGAGAAAALLRLMSARLASQAAARDMVRLSKVARLLQAHWQRGFPAWYHDLQEQARQALASCASDAASQPARRFVGRAPDTRGL